MDISSRDSNVNQDTSRDLIAGFFAFPRIDVETTFAAILGGVGVTPENKAPILGALQDTTSLDEAIGEAGER